MTNQDLERLNEFQNQASLKTFEIVFPTNNMGKHFWEKYNLYECNLLKLFASLDDEYKKQLLTYLNSNVTIIN